MKISEIDRYVHKRCSEKNWDDRFDYLVLRVFKKNAEAFDMSTEEILEDIDTFFSNVDSIQIIPTSDDTTGFYQPDNHLIGISNRLLTKKNELDLFNTLAHEVGHACVKPHILKSYDRTGRAYNEIATERAANITVYGGVDSFYDGYKIDNTEGYSEITFIMGVLCETYGMDEKELLNEMKKGVSSFDDYTWQKQYGYDMYSRGFHPKAIEANTNILYSVLYSNIPHDKRNVSEDSLNMSYALSNIYCNALRAWNARNFLELNGDSEKHYEKMLKSYRNIVKTMDRGIDDIIPFPSNEKCSEKIKAGLKGEIDEVITKLALQKIMVKNRENLSEKEIDYELRKIALWNTKAGGFDLGPFLREHNITSGKLKRAQKGVLRDIKAAEFREKYQDEIKATKSVFYTPNRFHNNRISRYIKRSFKEEKRMALPRPRERLVELFDTSSHSGRGENRDSSVNLENRNLNINSESRNSNINGENKKTNIKKKESKGEEFDR